MDTPPDDNHKHVPINLQDRKTFNTVYERHWLSLYRVAYKVLSNEESAKDVVQDVFVSLWERASFSGIQNIEAYLFRAVKLQCFMVLRSGSISKKHLERFTTVAHHASVSEEYDYKELQEVLEGGIQSLPERCREVFYLSRYESLSNKKIAEELNISHKTVENQISKALRVLRRSVDKLAVLLFF